MILDVEILVRVMDPDWEIACIRLQENPDPILMENWTRIPITP